MQESKRSARSRQPHIQEEAKLEVSESTSSPSYLINYSRGNTIEDHDDRYEENDKIKCDSRNPTSVPIQQPLLTFGQKQIQTFKQLPEAQDLLKSIPVQFRKKVRQVIRAYEQERKAYEIEVRKLQSELNNINLSIQQFTTSQKVIHYNQTDHLLSLQFKNIGSEASFSRVMQINNQEEIIKGNQKIQFIKEEFELNNLGLSEEVETLKEEINTKELRIEQQTDQIIKLNEYIHDLESKLIDFDNQFKILDQKSKAQDRKLAETQKSIRQKKSDANEASPTFQRKEKPYPNLTVITTNTIPQNNRNSSFDRSPGSATRRRNKSVRETLQKSRNFIFAKKQQEEVATSEVDSTEFGKEKVIEKRKIRKIFASLMSATCEEESRDALEKLGVEIGLKTKDIDIIFNAR